MKKIIISLIVFVLSFSFVNGENNICENWIDPYLINWTIWVSTDKLWEKNIINLLKFYDKFLKKLVSKKYSKEKNIIILKNILKKIEKLKINDKTKNTKKYHILNFLETFLIWDVKILESCLDKKLSDYFIKRDNSIYINKKYGFKMVFPKEWERREYFWIWKDKNEFIFKIQEVAFSIKVIKLKYLNENKKRVLASNNKYFIVFNGWPQAVVEWMEKEIGQIEIILNSIIFYQNFSIEKGKIFLNWEELYSTFFHWYKWMDINYCNSAKWKNKYYYKYPTKILSENAKYLIYNVANWYCEWHWWDITYILNKKTNVSKYIKLKNQLNTFDFIDNEKLILNEFDWWTFWDGYNIQEKWYYNNFNCEECWIKYKWTKTINFSEIEKYLEQKKWVLK